MKTTGFTMRHCEELLRRSNPGSQPAALDCFAPLAKTAGVIQLFRGVALALLGRRDLKEVGRDVIARAARS